MLSPASLPDGFMSYFGDLASIAYPIWLRRPDMPWSALRKIARKQDERDTFGRLGETGSHCVTRYRFGYDEAQHDTGICDPGQDQLEGIALPGEFISAIRAGHTIQESAALAGISRATLYREFARIRETTPDASRV